MRFDAIRNIVSIGIFIIKVDPLKVDGNEKRGGSGRRQ
jgi:hypothetical protein